MSANVGAGEICRPCLAHAGNPLQEVREHRQMWWELLDTVEEAHRSEVAQLSETIHGLRVQLDQRPEKTVQVTINEEAFTEVRDDMERAFRQRDWSYATLLRIMLLHRYLDSSACRCGQTRCPVADEIEDVRASLRGWERKQIQLFREDHRHLLPDAHPAVLDRRLTSDNGAIA